MPRLPKRQIAITAEKNGPTKPKMARIIQLEVPKRATAVGKVLVCGQGDMGQLGLGEEDTMFERKRPAIVESIEGAVDIVAGGMHSLVLTAEGIVYSFGCNDEGALGRDCSEDGSEFVPAIVQLPGKVVKISAGDSHSACLLEDGRVFAWGSFRDSHGNMGLTLEGNKRTPVNVLRNEQCCAIASGADHLVMLTITGKVYTVGCGEQGQLGRVSLRSASGEGRRGKTELLLPGQVIVKGRRLISEIWATNYCTFLREQRDDTIWAFGLNNYKQMFHSKQQETVINPINTKLSDIKQIAGGQHHTIVLKKDGSCFVVGRCDYGRLGLGKLDTDIMELKPVPALANKTIVQVSCGEAQSFALTDDGYMYAWGMGSNHQLGTGSEDDALTPVLIESKNTQGKFVLAVASGGQHTIFLVTDKAQLASDNVSSTVVTSTSKTSITTINKKQAAVAAVAAEKTTGKQQASKTKTPVTETTADDTEKKNSENTPLVTINGNAKETDVNLNTLADSTQSEQKSGKRDRKKGANK